jgi:hypothetical protein
MRRNLGLATYVEVLFVDRDDDDDSNSSNNKNDDNDL